METGMKEAPKPELLKGEFKCFTFCYSASEKGSV